MQIEEAISVVCGSLGSGALVSATIWQWLKSKSDSIDILEKKVDELKTEIYSKDTLILMIRNEIYEHCIVCKDKRGNMEKTKTRLIK